MDKKHNDVSVSQKSEGFTFNEKEISCLIKYGLILPQMQKTDTYWFAIRRQGVFMSHYLKGRVEILRILKKRPTHDIFEKVQYIFSIFVKRKRESDSMCPFKTNYIYIYIAISCKKNTIYISI